MTRNAATNPDPNRCGYTRAQHAFEAMRKLADEDTSPAPGLYREAALAVNEADFGIWLMQRRAKGLTWRDHGHEK